MFSFIMRKKSWLEERAEALLKINKKIGELALERKYIIYEILQKVFTGELDCIFCPADNLPGYSVSGYIHYKLGSHDGVTLVEESNWRLQDHGKDIELKVYVVENDIRITYKKEYQDMEFTLKRGVYISMEEWEDKGGITRIGYRVCWLPEHGGIDIVRNIRGDNVSFKSKVQANNTVGKNV